ncbi:serine O-acetyltransferase EpsC [Lewinella sp. 4G2]|uniref:serine O-acetyltransferase EpsC n=1 Tax=Lewinella sp. 4G2 TaxID=1803372 RepID=UPI0007B4B858|nr:serine O-acetyltransferase EpsC [Lewinella sp. 4G2]OAV46199.1 serine acetyltransferase [Lewinella sp. 4G2]
MNSQFFSDRYAAHQSADELPSPGLIDEWLADLLQFLFPAYSSVRFPSERALRLHYRTNDLKLFTILDTLNGQLTRTPEAIRSEFEERLPSIYEALDEDANAILAGDPAARSLTEVISTYPGFYALAVHRVAHALCQLGVPLVPRMLSEIAHRRTGIEIHPGATIGRRFCIDHGTGIVFGETVIIGDDVKVYQGVTLGALSVRKDMAKTKRHPTIADNVVIYAGATILGGDTIIGAGSIIGGNTWIVRSVPPNSRIYYKNLQDAKPQDPT